MEIFSELAVNVLASVILLGFGFLFGKYRERSLQQGRNLEEYDFYPFDVDQDKHLFFDLKRFSDGVSHLLRHRDRTAAQQLILIGQQNNVEARLTGEALRKYSSFYNRYGGEGVMDDTARFLENYERIVRLIGESFPDSGIEILLHNLSNPAKALSHLQNNVTGRTVGAPATNLVHDLKTRRLINQDKRNYELNIGSRRFKCTTIPIYREKLGLVGAICINVDYNYLDDVVRNDPASRELFLDALLRTDMKLDENILSKDEYENAMKGKRHFRDFNYSPM